MNEECEFCGGEPCDFPEECNPRREKIESKEYQDYLTRAHQGQIYYDQLLEECYDLRKQLEGTTSSKFEVLKMPKHVFQEWGGYYVVDNNGLHYSEGTSKDEAEKLKRNFEIVYKEGLVQGAAAERNKK